MKPVYDKKRTHMTRAIMTTAEFPLEVGEGNSKFEPKKIEKNSNPSIWSSKRLF